MSLPASTPRIGLGLDRHRLVAGRPCRLGGLDLESPVGPEGHSDGDAILHALTDALLGAAGLDDLGTLFPDTAPEWEGADSTRFLLAARERVEALGLAVASADVVAVCDAPRLGPHRTAMRTRLAELLAVPVDRVNVKGKSTEGAGGAAIDVTAVVLLVGTAQPAAP